MKEREYQIMYEIEDDFWWFVALRRLYRFLLGKKKGLILDVGCGTGRNLKMLDRYGEAVGLDFSALALEFSLKRGNKKLIEGDVKSLPFKDETFDIVLASDVLYHQWVDQEKAIGELNRVLKREGLLIFNTASYNFLKSEHDRAVMTKVRYTKKEFKKFLERNKFKVEKIFYWNSFLFPLVALGRVLEFKNRKNSELREINPLINKILKNILTIEIMLIRLGFSFPFGLSIMGRAKKL